MVRKQMVLLLIIMLGMALAVKSFSIFFQLPFVQQAVLGSAFPSSSIPAPPNMQTATTSQASTPSNPEAAISFTFSLSPVDIATLVISGSVFVYLIVVYLSIPKNQ